MTSYQYRKSHCGDKTILRPSYLHNGISYTGKITSLYWIRAQVLSNTIIASWIIVIIGPYSLSPVPTKPFNIKSMNQCWLIINWTITNIINWTLTNKFQWYFIHNTNYLYHCNALENVIGKMAIIIFRFQCVNSSWPSDIIWRHRWSKSRLPQVMACCLRASSHYLNQHWFIISEVQWSPEGNFTRYLSHQ